MDDSHTYNTQQQQVFYLLKDLMESVLHCEINTPSDFHIQKTERLRNELVHQLQNQPSIDHPFLQVIWSECFFRANEQFEMETLQKTGKSEISWQQVFDSDYSE